LSAASVRCAEGQEGVTRTHACRMKTRQGRRLRKESIEGVRSKGEFTIQEGETSDMRMLSKGCEERVADTHTHERQGDEAGKTSKQCERRCFIGLSFGHLCTCQEHSIFHMPFRCCE
jgi:hypothetical protein